MSCALTSDYNLDCRDSLGGLREVHFMEFDNLVSVTETAGVITAMSFATGKKFYRYKLPRETSSAESPLTGNEQNGSLFSTHTLKVVLNKMQSSTRSEILLLAKNRLVAVAKDMNGKYWLLGRTGGIELTTGAHSTGVAGGDRNGYELDFSGQEPETMIEVSAAAALLLNTAGA